MSPNQVRLDEFNRWVSPLQNNIGRVVAENLVAMLGTPRVTLSPQLLAADVNYRVGIEVQTFESAPGQAATLDAVWTVARTKDGRSRTGRTTVREPAPQPGYDALAAAHSRAVARLSRDIADAVGALDRLSLIFLARPGPRHRQCRAPDAMSRLLATKVRTSSLTRRPKWCSAPFAHASPALLG